MYRKNVAGQFFEFQGVDASTGGIKSGVTWTVRRCIDGTFAAATGTATEDGTTGWYKFAMSQADTNGNNIGFGFTGTGAIPQTVNILTTAADPTNAVNLGLSALPNTAVTTNASLLTSGTGTDQISVSAGKVLLQATQTGVTIPTVTTVTNQLTAAQVATGVWQDTTAGDFTVASSIGKSLYTTGNAPGAASGLALVGSNMGVATGSINSIADQVWDEVLSGHLTAGSTGNALNAAGSAGDPWSTVLPGAYGAGTAGKLIGDNINATISSRMATFTLPTNFSSILINGSGHISRVTLVDTITTYTGDTPQTGDSFARIGATGSGLTSIAAQITTDHGAGSYIRNTEPDNTSVAAVKLQTDKLTFDGSNNVAADTKKINSTAVNGTGISADKWRGA